MAIVFAAAGGATGGVGGWMFFAIWTAVFGRVPLKHAWAYADQDPGTMLLGTAFVVASAAVGLGVGLAKGLRWRRDSS